MIKVIYDYTCDGIECAVQTQVAVNWEQGQVLPLPQPPEGWAVVGSKCFCDKHDIFIEVEDKAVKGYPRATVGVRRRQSKGNNKGKNPK